MGANIRYTQVRQTNDSKRKRKQSVPILAAMKQLLTTFLLCLSIVASAQTIDIAKKYSLSSFATGALSGSYTYATAKAKYPAFIVWAEYLKMTQAEVLAVNEFAAAWNDAVWSTDGYVAPNAQGAYPQNGCQSRANIDASGIYYAKTNIPCIIAFGIYSGGGTGNYTDASGTTGGTQIEVDHARWISRVFPGRYLMQTDTWANNTILGYQESFIVDGFRLEGGYTSKPYDPTFESAGIAIWDSGETSRVQHVYAFGFNTYGFLNVRGTPTIFDGCSAFSNGIGGFGLLGNDLSTIALYSPSGDDNGALVYVRAGYDRPGGSTLLIANAKNESGKRTPYRRQKFIDAQGALNIVVTGAWVHAIDGPENVIEVDFQGYGGGLDVSGLRYDGYANLLKLTAKGVTTTYKGPGNYLPVSFVANETGVVWSSRALGGAAPVPVPPDPTPVPPTPVPTPPATWVSVWTGTTVTSTTCATANVTATQVRLSGWKPTSLSYGRIVGTGNGKPSLQLWPDGYFYFNNTKVTSTLTAPVVSGRTYNSVTITIPQSTVTAVWQTDCSQGGAATGNCTKVELK
jgi:hypothetical protein